MFAAAIKKLGVSRYENKILSLPQELLSYTYMFDYMMLLMPVSHYI